MKEALIPRQTTPMIADHTRTTRRTLLVVDDDESVRRSLQLVFSETYETLFAESGPQALELISQHPVDAAILDIRMNGMSGIELLEKMKNVDPSIEALILTGYETMETVRLALRFGACDYLSKPFNVETIRSAVANAMERRSLADEIRSTHEKMSSLQGELQQQSLREEITRNRGEIYASVLHDINGPLTVIAGYVDLINLELEMRHRLDGDQIETVKEHLRLINRQVTQCIDVSRRYLGFLRRKPLERTIVPVNTVFEDLKALLKAHPSRRRNQLLVQTVAGDPVVEINGADLIQVILNLATNAFDASEKVHPVTISGTIVTDASHVKELENSSADQVVFSENFENASTLVRITVEDQGSGIPSENLSRIFEPYFSTKGDRGTGLGLSIVQRLVTEAGGALHVHSEIGKGTAFHIYLRGK